MAKLKTHCVNGHPLSGDNLLLRMSKGYQHRECRECKRARGLARNAVDKASRAMAPKTPRRHRSSDDRPADVQLAEKVRVTEDGCWVWTGRMQNRGYGLVRVDGKPALTHRVSYELHVGPIPDGLHIDHLCRNRACCNPAHLEPVTHRENVLRGVGPSAVNAKRTECKHGHHLSGDNLRVYVYGSKTMRVCVTCNRANSRATNEAIRLAKGGHVKR